MSCKTIHNSENAPAPIGAYNQAVEANGFIFLSGQIPLNPETMELVEGDIEAEAKQVMENLKAVLTKSGVGFEDVVKTSIFLNNMGDFAKVNAVYGSYFDEETAPARETVAVCTLPKNVRVEISMIAVKCK